MEDNDANDITVPSVFGTITEGTTGPADSPLLVHVADAHCNAEVQRNIAAIGRHLVEGHHFRLFAVEGTPGPINVGRFRRQFGEQRAMIERELDSGRLTGPEWLAISHVETLTVHGIEDQEVYRRNHLAMVEVLREGEPARAWLGRLRGALLGLPGTPEMWANHALLGLLGDGVGFRLLRESYLPRAQALADLDLSALLGQIAACSRTVGDELAPGLALARRVVANVLVFYECAVARDGILFANTLAAMRVHAVDRAVVVTGGFHVGGFRTLARERGMRAVFVRPQISWLRVQSEDEKYKKIMVNQNVGVKDRA